MKRLLLFVGLVACATTTRFIPTDVLHVSVESQSTYASRVRLYCERNGGQIGFAIRDLAVARVVRQDVRLGTCRFVQIVLEGPGRFYQIPDAAPVSPGDTLIITAKNPLRMSDYTIR